MILIVVELRLRITIEYPTISIVVFEMPVGRILSFLFVHKEQKVTRSICAWMTISTLHSETHWNEKFRLFEWISVVFCVIKMGMMNLWMEVSVVLCLTAMNWMISSNFKRFCHRNYFQWNVLYESNSKMATNSNHCKHHTRDFIKSPWYSGFHQKALFKCADTSFFYRKTFPFKSSPNKKVQSAKSWGVLLEYLVVSIQFSINMVEMAFQMICLTIFTFLFSICLLSKTKLPQMKLIQLVGIFNMSMLMTNIPFPMKKTKNTANIAQTGEEKKN